MHCISRRRPPTIFSIFCTCLSVRRCSLQPATIYRRLFSESSSPDETSESEQTQLPPPPQVFLHDDGSGADSDRFFGGGEAIHFYKSRGQHILTNPSILDAIVGTADVRATDTVLEIGPGTGNLTLRLLRAARSVVVVEVDGRMIDVLRHRAAALGVDGRLTVIHADALKTQLPFFDVCVSNIPYCISSPLIERILLKDDPLSPRGFRSATLLLQKEFAERLLAEPGDPEFNRLAANINLVATSQHVMHVSRRDFIPCPRVDSSVVQLRPKGEVPAVNLEEWWAFTLACFGKKNKTLGAIFRQKKRIAELSRLAGRKGVGGGGEEKAGEKSFKDDVIEILRAGGFEEKRPSKLSHEELLHLLSLFNKAGIYFR